MATTAPNRRLSVFSVAPAFNIFLGVWSVGMPYFLQFTSYDGARMISTSIGFFVILLAITRLAVSPAYFWSGWVNVLLGAVIASTPFILGLSSVTDLTIAMTATGIAIMLFAAIGQFERVD